MTTTQPTAGQTATPRPARGSRRVRTWQVLLLWAICMAPLTMWGLPTSATDDLLFGGDPPWHAERYDAARKAEERRRRAAGADTDLDPLAQTDRIVDLTADEDARAAILLRYRLYSRQPDEVITFMALQQMNPRNFDFDPKLYQYGGGYIYLIGAAVGLTSLLGITHLTSDIGVYLAEPEQFARFYVAARFVSLVFGALTLVGVTRLARRAAGRRAGWIALVCVACCPVFYTAVLEAKPHLPSVCLLLWATLSALDYHAEGHRRDALRMGLAGGYAFGLVLTGIAAALLWPVLLVARRDNARRTVRHLVLAGALALLVYLLTNPFIPYNLVFNRESLASNVANSTAMYTLGGFGAGAARVGRLLVESAGWGVPLVGLVGYVILLRKWRREALIASISGVGMLLLCVAIGAGKPAEFARFLLLPSALLCVATAWVLAELWQRRVFWGLLGTIAVVAAMRTPYYARSFGFDARGERESRHLAARFLHKHADEADAIGVLQEPAPYAVPPLDFAHRRVLWLPTNEPADLNAEQLPVWLVFTADDPEAHRGAWWRAYYRLRTCYYFKPHELTRIAWANKPVFILLRRDAAAR